MVKIRPPRRSKNGGAQAQRRQRRKPARPIVPKTTVAKDSYSSYLQAMDVPRPAPAAPGDKPVTVTDDFGMTHMFHTGDAGAKWVTAVTNPFGTGELGNQTVLERPPDGDSSPTYLIKTTGRTVFSGATATSGLIQLLGHNVTSSTSGDDLVILYGNDATSAAASPTTQAVGKADQEANLGTIWTSSDQGRIVAGGLRVKSNMLDTASGIFQAYDTKSIVRYGATTYDPYGAAYANKIGDLYDIRQGITVRKAIDDTSMNYVTALTSGYAAAASVFGSMPAIQFSQLSTTTSLTIEWVVVYEVRARVMLAFPPGRSDYERDFTGLMWYINQCPQVSAGNSFKPFKEIWRNIKAVGKWAWQNGIGSLAKTGVQAAASRYLK